MSPRLEGGLLILTGVELLISAGVLKVGDVSAVLGTLPSQWGRVVLLVLPGQPRPRQRDTATALVGHSLHPGRGSGLCQLPKATREAHGSTN